MMYIQFNTPASNRALKKSMALISKGSSVAASLGSKRRSVSGEVDSDRAYDVCRALKALKCTSIQVSNPKMYFKDEGGFWLTTLDKETHLPPVGIDGEIGVPYDSAYQKAFYSRAECMAFAFKNNFEPVIE